MKKVSRSGEIFNNYGAYLRTTRQQQLRLSLQTVTFAARWAAECIRFSLLSSIIYRTHTQKSLQGMLFHENYI